MGSKQYEKGDRVVLSHLEGDASPQFMISKLIFNDWRWHLLRVPKVDNAVSDDRTERTELSSSDAYKWIQSCNGNQSISPELAFQTEFGDRFLISGPNSEVFEFDPRGWTLVGVCHFDEGLEDVGEGPSYSTTEWLFRAGDNWLVVERTFHHGADIRLDPNLSFITAIAAADWCVENRVDLRADVRELSSYKLLTPEMASTFEIHTPPSEDTFEMFSKVQCLGDQDPVSKGGCHAARSCDFH